MALMPHITLTPPEAPLIEPEIRVVEFVVPGRPVTWARMRHSPHGAEFIPDDRRAHMGEIRRAWTETGEAPFGRHEALLLEAEFIMPRSPSHFKKRGGLTSSAPRWPGKNLGDLDNLEKIVKDSLNLIAYHDDSQIQRCTKGKRFVEGDEMPRSILVLRTL
jgi:Holliday junction resolvase RusA-like endonuclease